LGDRRSSTGYRSLHAATTQVADATERWFGVEVRISNPFAVQTITTPLARACGVRSSFLIAAVAQHGEGDSPTPDGLVGQTDPALSLRGDGELVIQVL